MTRSAAQLAQRRADLLAHSARLRSELQETVAGLGTRLQLVDQAATFLRGAGGPLVVGGVLTLLLFRGPRRILRLAGRIALVWPVLRPWLPRLGAWLRERTRAER